jgi:IMP dehydrogenase/GMP reductase
MINKSIGYGYNDLCIVPAKISNIKSRSECKPFYTNQKLPIFASPMSAVVNVENYKLWEMNGITPILPRNIDYNIRYEYLLQGKWVALSLSEFENIFIKNDDFFEEVSVIPHVLIDVANGHMQHLINVCKQVKQSWSDNIVLMAGNIANPETYLEYCEAGIDYVRCSIGSGSCCTTASNTAVHYPIASLIDEINNIKQNRKHIYESAYDQFTTKVIADGGIRNYNDVIKALALGADYVMIGGLFSSFIESAGEIVDGNSFVNLDNISKYEYDIKIINQEFDADYLLNKIIIKGPLKSPMSMSDKFDIYNNCDGVETFKVLLGNNLIQYFYIFDIYNHNLHEDIKRSIVNLYKFKKHMYGMSTKTAQRLIKSNNELKTAEGIEKTIEVKYTMKQWTENMIDYLKSAMSYCDCRTLEQFIGKQELVIQSTSEIFSVNK